MLHKLSAGSAMSRLTPAPDRKNSLHLAQPGERRPAVPNFDLVQVLSRRCSSFCAEAAVLVLVFGLLDYFMMKGHIELGWIAGALLISVALLALSIVIELSAQRWIKAHP
jgi:hypothetical protein